MMNARIHNCLACFYAFPKNILIAIFAPLLSRLLRLPLARFKHIFYFIYTPQPHCSFMTARDSARTDLFSRESNLRMIFPYFIMSFHKKNFLSKNTHCGKELCVT
jgi:hypothetical protein